MTTTEKIADGCDLNDEQIRLLDRVLDEKPFAQSLVEDSLCEIIGALFRRVETLEQLLSGQ